MRADADGEDIAADNRVHPYRCMLAEDDVADNLRGVVHVAGRRNCRFHAFEGRIMFAPD